MLRRCLCSDLRRALLSKRAIIAVAGYCIFLCANLPTDPWPNDVPYLFSVSYKYGFYIFFFLCAAIPFSTSFLADIDTGYLRSVASRVSIRAYSISKCVTCAITGGLCVVCASALFLGCLYARFPAVPEQVSSYSGWDALLLNAPPLAYFLVKIAITAMLGACFSVVALAASTVIRNSFVVLAMPVLLFYSLNEAATGFSFPTFLDIGVWLYLPVFQNSFLWSFLYLFGVCTITSGAAWAFFDHQIRRLQRNGYCT